MAQLNEIVNSFYSFFLFYSIKVILNSSTSNEERNYAHIYLQDFFEKNLSIEKLKTFCSLIENEKNEFTVILASNAICSILKYTWTLFTAELKTNLYKLLLTKLYEYAPNLLKSEKGKLVIIHYIKLFSLFVKVFFEEFEANKKILDDIQKFFELNLGRSYIGLKILEGLVEEIQNDEFCHSASRFRRILIEFKDHILPNILEISFYLLNNVSKFFPNNDYDKQFEEEFLKVLLTLIQNCLCYNFIGDKKDTLFQEEYTPLLIPTRVIGKGSFEQTQWSILANESTINLIFEIYLSSVHESLFKKSCAVLSLKILGSLCRIKLSFFPSNLSHSQYILFIIRGLRSILQDKTGLQDNDILTEFSNVIGKTNRNMAFESLINETEYLEWIENIYNITITSIHNASINLNILQNFIEFWTYFSYYVEKRSESQYLKIKSILLEICFKLIESKLETQFYENPLQNIDLLIEHLKFLSLLAKPNISEIINILNQKLDGIGSSFILDVTNKVYKYMFAMIIHIINNICFGFLNSIGEKKIEDSNYNNQFVELAKDSFEETMNSIGNLLSKIFLMSNESIINGLIVGNQHDSLITECFYRFYEKFVKSLISNKTKVDFLHIHTTIAINLKLNSKNDVISLIISKILDIFESKNIKFFSHANSIFSNLIENVKIHYLPDTREAILVVGKLLLKEENFQQIYCHHLQTNFEILFDSGKERIKLYQSLSKIVFLKYNISNDENLVKTFLQPFSVTLNFIKENKNNLDKTIYRKKILNLSFDLYGCLLVIEQESIYSQIIDLLQKNEFYDIYFNYLNENSNDVQIMTRILYVLSEILYNKSNRISIKKSSSSIFNLNLILIIKGVFGLKLFKNISNLLNICLKIIISKEEEMKNMNSELVYEQKFKPISLVLKIFTRIILSNVVNLSILDSYKDQNLTVFMNQIFQIIINTSCESITSYIKRMKNIYETLEILSQKYFFFILKFPSETFGKILQIMNQGIQSFDFGVCINSYDYIIHLFNYKFLDKSKEIEENETIEKYLYENCEKIQEILKTMFIMILKGEISNYSYLSKALLGLILSQKNYTLNLLDNLSDFFGQEHKQRLLENLNFLILNVPPTYEERNKEQFLATFKKFIENLNGISLN